MTPFPITFEVRGTSYSLTVLDDEGLTNDPTLLIFREDEEEAFVTAHLTPDADCTDPTHVVLQPEIAL